MRRWQYIDTHLKERDWNLSALEMALVAKRCDLRAAEFEQIITMELGDSLTIASLSTQRMT